MKTISFTVPMDYNALTRVSDMLHGMAIDLKHEGAPITGQAEDLGPAIEEEVKTTTQKMVETFAEKMPAETVLTHRHPADDAVVEGAPGSITEDQPAATEIFGDPKSNGVTETPASTATKPASSTETSSGEASVETATVTAGSGVELDSDGLPWDHRIHALGVGGAHNKLKKTEQWKKKRGSAAELVTKVEAELRAAMAAGPDNPVVTTDTPAPPPSTEETTKTPAPAATSGAVTTFPELMAAITANGIDQAAVLAAVNTQGLTALPLLAARPELIPAVAKALGV